MEGKCDALPGNCSSMGGDSASPTMVNRSEMVGVLPQEPTDLISDDVRYLVVELIMNTIVQISLRTFGIVSNVINILIFFKLGLDDGVTASFFARSVADLMWSCAGLSVRLTTMVEVVFGHQPYVRLRSVAYILSWYSAMFLDASNLITLFLSVQKCACVAIPLVFKNVFNARRCRIILVCLSVGIALWYLPILSAMRMTPLFDKATNGTRLRGVRADYYRTFYTIWRPVNRVALPAVSLTLVSICLIIFVYKLLQAIKVRKSMTSDPKGSKNLTTKTKEVRVIQAVVLVSTIFVVCYIPDIIRRSCEMFFPIFRARGPYDNTHKLVHQVHNIMTLINASVNIFVYLKYNSRYRQVFVGVFKWGSSKKFVR